LLFAFARSKPNRTAPLISVTAAQLNNSGIHMMHVIVVDDAGGYWIHLEENVEEKLTTSQGI
jgi:hypothetical protein